MKKLKKITLVAGILFCTTAYCQDTIVIQESSKTDWALGNLDSLNTWSDTLTLDTVSTYHFLFSNCGQTGLSGPTQGQINSTYSGSDLDGMVTTDSGIQHWQTPEAGLYRLTAAGAGHNADSFIRGAIVGADFELAKSASLMILVGQMGDSPRAGNGGTFVTFADTTPLIIAGGAAGMRSYVDAANRGSTATSGQSVSGPGCSAAGGIAGNGGQSIGGGGCSGAGGGLYSNGLGCGGGFAFINGGAGGNASYIGGFGGGGGVNSASSPGGGGGYSGGSVHYTGGGSSCAGGGGSFIATGAKHVKTSDGYYDNISTFNGDTIASLENWNSGHGYFSAEAMQYVNYGVRTSPVYDISGGSSVHVSSSITWQADTLTGTSVLVETRYSTNAGNQWTAWDTVSNGSPVAGLSAGIVMDSARLQTKITLATTSLFASPRFYSIDVSVVNDSLSAGIVKTPLAIKNVLVQPNPFDQTININYFLTQPSNVSIKIFSIVGESILLKKSRAQSTGNHQLQLNTSGLNLPAGLYWLEITTNGIPVREKLMHF